MSPTTTQAPPSANAQILALLEAQTPAGSYIPADVAAKVAADLRLTDPALFEQWATDKLTSWLTDVLNARIASTRAHNVSVVRKATNRTVLTNVQDAAAHLATTGDSKPLQKVRDQIFEDMWAVDTANTKKALGDMTKADLTFVAKHYGETARQAGAREQMFIELAKGIRGKKTVAETYTAEQIVAMMAVYGV